MFLSLSSTQLSIRSRIEYHLNPQVSSEISNAVSFKNFLCTSQTILSHSLVSQNLCIHLSRRRSKGKRKPAYLLFQFILSLYVFSFPIPVFPSYYLLFVTWQSLLSSLKHTLIIFTALNVCKHNNDWWLNLGHPLRNRIVSKNLRWKRFRISWDWGRRYQRG